MPKRDPEGFYENMSAVVTAVRAAGSAAYSAFGVGSAQAKFLRHIQSNSRISQAELARATDTAPTLTGRALETLIERGWVKRTRSKEDRRQYVLELTASGQRLAEQIVGARSGIIARISTALDAKDHKDFERIARKVLDELGSPGSSADD